MTKAAGSAPNPDPDSSVAIFSSFRKFMPEVAAARDVFLAHGIQVTNPPSVEPLDPKAQFVRFPADDPELPDHVIQSNVLRAALASTVLYVVCPGGYVGNTVSLELGFTNRYRRPLYFSETPQLDVARQLSEGRVVDAHTLAHMMLDNQLSPGPEMPDTYLNED